MCVLIYVCIRFAGATYRHVVCQVTSISSIAVPQLWIHSNGLRSSVLMFLSLRCLLGIRVSPVVTHVCES
uniref:Uncharacterized protein n=1 Tax=Anguilla anguilla TaxID=7936 RepID=A0A0E9UAV7_ANGAN